MLRLSLYYIYFDRDDVIDEMQKVIQSRDGELAEISKQVQC